MALARILAALEYEDALRVLGDHISLYGGRPENGINLVPGLKRVAEMWSLYTPVILTEY